MQENATTRHPSLPAHLDASGLQTWLRINAKEKFTDQRKKLFTREEIIDFEHESSVNGRAMNKLNDLLKKVREAVTKGHEGAPLIIEIHETPGTKMLEAYRRQNDDFVETGYELLETEVFGIPNEETKNMDYFDIEGNEVTERRRPLSHKERIEFFGMFDGPKLSVDTSVMKDAAGF